MFKELLDYLNPSRKEKEIAKKRIEKFVEDNFMLILIGTAIFLFVIPKITLLLVGSFILYNYYK